MASCAPIVGLVPAELQILAVEGLQTLPSLALPRGLELLSESFLWVRTAEQQPAVGQMRWKVLGDSRSAQISESPTDYL